MLLETKRLVILSIAEPKFDELMRSIVYVNGIFLKPNGITAKCLQENPHFVSQLNLPIGLISIGENGWIDYLIDPNYQRNGYATESLKAAKQFIIAKKIKPFLVIHSDNLASITVAERCGFKRVAGTSIQGRYSVV